MHRDNEDAYVSVNGKTCWIKTGLIGTSGIQECGGFFKEERLRVTGCYATLEENMPMTVRVWTSLDSGALDESFAIDNVVMQPIGKGNSVVLCVRAHMNIFMMNTVVSTVADVFYYWQQGLYCTRRHLTINKISTAGTAVR